MAITHDTRRKVIFLVVALVVVALVLASTGCSTSSDSGEELLSPALYTQSMSDICAATTERLSGLPTPPEEISRGDWAIEVSRALRDEAAAFDEIRVGESLRTNHASIVENTQDQAAQWLALSEALSAADTGDSSIGDLTTEIAQLTLGRDDLADEMGLAGCGARELT